MSKMSKFIDFVKRLFGARPGSFERYTEHAKRTIFFGRWEALQAGADLIQPEHIALGLLRDEWILGEILSAASANELRPLIIEALPSPKEPRTDVGLPLDGRAKRVITNAAADAEALRDRHIGDEHLLLGLLREERLNRKTALTNALLRGGLTLEKIRSQINAIPREVRRKHGDAQRARWREAGIPDDYVPSKLLYNAAAEVLILELKKQSEAFYPKRIMIRHKSATHYAQVGNPADDVSYESPATCEKQPLICFNSMKMSTSEKGGYRGADWEAAHIFDLHTKEISTCISKENFVAPPPYDERGWITEIFSISDDGSFVYVEAALGKSKAEAGKKVEVRYDYHLARLNLQDGSLVLVAHLPNIYF